MSAVGRLLKKAFLRQSLSFRRKVLVKAATGSPNGVTAGVVGSLCYVVADDDTYICTAAPNTWVKINA